MAERKALQRVITTVHNVTEWLLLSLEDLYISCCLKNAQSILKDPSYPRHFLFELLLLGTCVRF